MAAGRSASAAPEGGVGPIRHIPVLLPQVLTALAPRAGAYYIDATFGAGGYTRAILESADCSVRALDRDPGAIAAGGELVREFAPRLTLEQMPFGGLLEEAQSSGRLYDGLVLDLGVSSMQLDEPERGFSFLHDGPLDMRMSAVAGADPAALGPSAADIVNSLDERQIADILFKLGEERRSRAIAAAILARRSEQPIARTRELADLVARTIGSSPRDAKHPATRTFQGLRIYVNDELGELTRVLAAAELLLRPGGKLVAVTFHSLEDRIVKQFLAERSGRRPGASRHMPGQEGTSEATFRLLNRKPTVPSDDEVAANPRARSAKLRAAERIQATAPEA